LLLLESGGVRLQEATLGLAAIASIHAGILNLGEYAPVVAVIAGPVGCFGGMSLAAELCTYVIGTPHGRLGMNGPEVIEQEAGPDEIDASDRELIWQIVGCEARYRDGWIDAFVQDNQNAISVAVQEGMKKGPLVPTRMARATEHLNGVRLAFDKAHRSSATKGHTGSRGRVWLEKLSDGGVKQALATASILTADIALDEVGERAFAISIVPDAGSRLPRAATGELGLEQGWALAACLDQFMAEEEKAGTRRPIIAIVDTPGQAYGRIEEQCCISAAAAAAVNAYARARRAGHPVLTLVVGRAVSGSFLAHGLQSDHIFALSEEDVSMYAMSAQSIARITRRTLVEVQAVAAATLPMSFAIQDAYRLGVIDTLIENVCAEDPTAEDLTAIQSSLSKALAAHRRGDSLRSGIKENPYRRVTQNVRDAMRAQWIANDQKTARVEFPGIAGQMVDV